MQIILGKWTQDKLDSLISEASKFRDAGARINFLSGLFLGTDYKESTLIGDADTPEVFVINLKGADCFTYIDYIEAMRLSGSYSEFKANVKTIRYRSGIVSFKNRNHFFTDWIESNSKSVRDVTVEIGAQKTKKTTKLLNYREDGTYFINGIQPVQKEINHIPSRAVEGTVLDKLKTGDYAGIYSASQGLDVSHVGIIIKQGGAIYLRHASSEKKHKKVVDQDFKKYIYDKPGLIVLRPKELRG